MFKNSGILKIFFEKPATDFNVREIARRLKISASTASIQLKNLAEKSILKQKKDRICIFYRANLESSLYRDMKIFYTIRRLKDSGLINYLNKFYSPSSIILFGSASHGLDAELSDIDLLLLSDKPEEFPGKKHFERKLNRHLHIFSVKSMESLMNEHLIKNAAKGIRIEAEQKWTLMSATKKD